MNAHTRIENFHTSWYVINNKGMQMELKVHNGNLDHSDREYHKLWNDSRRSDTISFRKNKVII